MMARKRKSTTARRTKRRLHDLQLVLQLMRESSERLARLPEVQRRAMLLTLADELSYNDVAQRLDISLEMLHEVLSRARESIRRMIVEKALH